MPPPLRDDRAVAHDHEAVQVGALDRVEEVEHPPRQDTLLVRRAPGQAASGHGRSLNGLRPGAASRPTTSPRYVEPNETFTSARTATSVSPKIASRVSICLLYTSDAADEEDSVDL